MVSIKLVNVTKKFGKVIAVNNVNLEIRDSEFMALLGPSGSGKSTILYLIAGIYKPTSGRIFFGEKDVTQLPPKERNVGLVFQNWALYPHMKVYDNIAFPLRLKKVPEEDIKKKVVEVADMLRISHLLDRYPHQLSGGQQQRVAIARALVKEPQVLLLDEPLSNLDALLRISVRAELKRLQKRLGITTVYVTHDQAEALAMADRIAVINEGRILQVGTPETVYSKPSCKFVGGFLGNPPMNFIEAEVISENGNHYIVIGKSKLLVPRHYIDIVAKIKPDKVIVGFRPEDTHIFPASASIDEKYRNRCFYGEVYAVEPLGRENIVTVSIDNVMVKVIVPRGETFNVGEKVMLCPIEEKIVLFDVKTEKALELQEQESNA
ncbi:ABC transporter ATP-binding protein [Desulfurococcaceae archaeon MEX13E-LK6-19]|nr:ABC transporter ATP-binding protein [Desulfurococcaceae archaeon MEX13E-LK6-19]